MELNFSFGKVNSKTVRSEIRSAISILLAVLIAFSSFAVSPVWAVASGTEDFTWEYDADTHTLTVSGSGDMPDYTETFEQETPASIAPWAEYVTEIEKILVSEGFSSIGDCAFAFCTNVKEVVLPEGITDIGMGAFAYCVDLTDITLPSTLLSIGAQAFGGCFSVKELKLPDSVKSIGDMAFVYMFGLEKLNLPASLQEISDSDGSPFLYLVGLKEIVIPAGLLLEEYDFYPTLALALERVTNNSASFTASMTFEYILGGYFDSLEYADVYSYLYKNYFKYMFFAGPDAIAIPGVEISENDLMEDTLTYVNAKLGTNYNVSDFTDFVEVYEFIYESVLMTHIIAGSGCPSYYSVSCLENSSQHEFCKTNAVHHKIIGEDELCACFEMSGTLNDSITWTVDADTRTLIFDGSGEMPEFEEYAEYLQYSNYIENIAFAEGSSITYIAGKTFYGLKNVTEITVPEGVTALGEYVFKDSGVKVINLPASLGSFYISSFLTGTAPIEEINVAEGNEYLVSYEGSLYHKGEEFDGKMTYILMKQVEKNANKFLDNTITIFCYAFENYSTVEEITVPDTVFEVAEAAFYNCSSLKTVNIGNSKIYEVDGETFSLGINEDFIYGCNSLTAINVDENNINYTSVDGVLYNKAVTELITVPTGISEVEVPETVTTVYRYAFDYINLDKVTFLNAACELDSCEINSEATIRGYKDSTAEAYADTYNRNFEYIDGITITSVEVDTANVKTVYVQYENLNTEGLVMTVNFSDGTSTTKSSGFVVSGFNSNVLGTQELTVKYRDFYCNYSIEVVVHDYVQDIKEATCTEDGSITYTCSICGDSYTEVIYASGHIDKNGDKYCDVCTYDYCIGNLTVEEELTVTVKDRYTDQYIRFEAEETEYIKINISGDVSGWVYIYDSDGNELDFDSYSENYPGTCGFAVEKGKAYFVRFYNYSDNGTVSINVTPLTDKNLVVGSAITVPASDKMTYFKFVPAVTANYMFNFKVQENYVYLYVYDCELNALTWFYIGTSDYDDYEDFEFEEGKTYYIGVDSSSTDSVLEFMCPHTDTNTDNSCDICGISMTDVIATGTHGDNITWSLKANGELTLEGSGEMYDDKVAYDYKNIIKKVILGADITTICGYAFSGYSNLKEVIFEEETKLTSIGAEALSGTAIESIIIPSTLTTIETAAFANCQNLENFIIDSDNTSFSVADGVLFNKDATVLKVYPSGKKETEYIIPDGVKELECDAFCETRLETVTIPESITALKMYNFYYNPYLKNLVIPETIDSIESYSVYASASNITVLNKDCILEAAAIYPIQFIDTDGDGVFDDNQPGTISGYTASTAEDYAEYNDIAFESLDDRYATKIEIIETPKTEYIETDDFTTENLKLLVTYDDGSTAEKMYGFEAEGFSRTNYGESKITIKYKNCTTSYDITIDEVPQISVGEKLAIDENNKSGWFKFTPSVRNCYSVTVNTADAVIPEFTKCFYDSEMDYSFDTRVTYERINFEIGEIYYVKYSFTDEEIPSDLTLQIICAYNHSFGDWETTKSSACVSGGEELRYCSICNYCEKRTVDALGHSIEWRTYIEATCTETGVEKAYCSRCNEAIPTGEILCDPETYPESRHNYENGQTYEYSFTYKDAKNLILKFSADTETESYHDKIYIYDSDGTSFGPYSGTELQSQELQIEGESFTIKLTTSGSGSYYGFSFDSITAFVETETEREISPLGHDYSEEWTVDTEATCTKDGSKSHHCSRCDSKSDVTAIPLLGHDYASSVTAPTCTKQGYTTYVCSRCDDTYVDDYVDALGHTWGEWEVTTDPTCTNKGEETRNCTVCSAIEKQAVEALGHDYSEEWTVDTEATCTKDGSKSHHCSRCDSKSDVTAIPLLGHDYASSVTAPTCTKQGYTTYVCSRCDDTYVDDYVDALGHTWGEWEVTTDPTCTNKGEETRTCTVCSAIEKQAVEALGHDYSEEWTVDIEATCTKDGSKSHHCSRCDSKSDVTAIPLLGHDYASSVTAPTCTKQGYTTYVCSRCSDTYVDDYVDALGHTWGDWEVTTDPTCTNKGEETRTCTVCSATEKQAVEALGHDYSEEWTVDIEATCTKDGSKSHHCSRCDSKSDITAIPLLGHDYASSVTAPTCTKQGYTTYVCSRCDDTYVDGYVDASGHSYESVVTAPTCTNDGYTTYTCSVCYDSYTDTVVPAFGHSYTQWSTVKEATCTVKGSRQSNCDNCGTVSTATIEALGHSFGEWNIVTEATVLAEGLSTRTCDRCSVQEESVIEKVYVDIENNTEYGLANFTVVDAQTLEPIKGAGIFVSTENDGENTFFTDEEGKVSIILPVGKQMISAYAKDCLTRNLKINVKSGENDIPQIGLSSKNTYDVEITHDLMTYEEIVEAGIDVNDPDNQHMYKYELRLEFVPEIDWISFFYYMNGAGQIVGGGSGSGSGGSGGSGGGGSWVSGSGSGGTGGYYYRPATDTEESITVYPVSEYFYLIIRGEVKWLKEMFDVEMLIINNSMTDTLEDLTATLTLPDGLSLAAMVGEEQSLSYDIDKIAEGESQSVHWYVRGDKAGSYSIEALLEGMVMPFEEEINDVFVADDLLQVWAGNALHLDFEFPSAAYYGEDYPITVTLTNVSDITLYNVSHMIQIEQGMEVYYSDGTSKKKVETSSWGGTSVPVFNPGDKIIIESSVNIFFKSEVIEHQLQQYCDMVTGVEKLINGFKAVQAGLDIASSLVDVVSSAGKALDIKASVVDALPDAKKDATKQLYDSISSLYSKISVSDNKSIDTGSELVNTGISEVLDYMSSDSAIEYILSKDVDDIVEIATQIDAFADSFTVTDEDIENFNIFDSIRTLISSLPVKFVLTNVIMNDDFAENTTKIPWSYTVTEAGPQYFGVSNVSSYLSNIMKGILAEAWEETSPGWCSLIPSLDDPFNYDDIKCEIIAVEKEIEQFKAKDATGEVSFRAYYVPNTSVLRSRSAVSTQDYELSCDNETTKVENGVLTFTGEGNISLTPLNTNGGTLYIEDSEGNTYTYEINVVEAHECTAGEQRVVVSPTADTDGFAVKCCETCEDIMEIINLTACSEHSFGEWQTVSEATCTVSGVEKRECSVCGYTETAFTDALGHTESVVNKSEATCTEDGYSGDTVCTVCEETLTVGETVKATGHGYVAVITNPTCTEKGYTTNTCSVCGDSFISDEKAALGHNVGSYSLVSAPTCTSDGYEVRECSRCSYYETRTVGATGHTDVNGDGYCDDCSRDLSPSANCGHMCHKTGFLGFIWKIVLFFQKLFGMNPTCECGVSHY